MHCAFESFIGTVSLQSMITKRIKIKKKLSQTFEAHQQLETTTKTKNSISLESWASIALLPAICYSSLRVFFLPPFELLSVGFL